MEYEACYTYKPSHELSDSSRPNKRRRTELEGLQESWPRRKELFEQKWRPHQERLQRAILQINKVTVASVAGFVGASYHHDSPAVKGIIPAALISVGSSLTAQHGFFAELSNAMESEADVVFVQLAASQASNLKSTLSSLISRAVTTKRAAPMDDSDDADDDNDDNNDQYLPVSNGASRVQRRSLKYDLQILADAVRERDIHKIVITFQDCEAFDDVLLSDLINILSPWTDRIPFVLIFGIATSIDSLQAMLTRKAIRSIRGRRFDLMPAAEALETSFAALRPQLYHPESSTADLWIGSALFSNILTRQRDHVQSLQDFCDGYKYAHMTAFYANALTLLLDTDLKFQDFSSDHLRALRHLPSVKIHVQQLMDKDIDSTILRGLLVDDQKLFEYARERIDKGCEALREIWDSIHLIQTLGENFETSNSSTRLSNLYVEAFAGRLCNSPLVRELLLGLQRADSNSLSRLLCAIAEKRQDDLVQDLKVLRSRLDALLSRQKNKDKPLRSALGGGQNEIFTTTITSAKKVELSKAKQKLTKADEEYNDILKTFVIMVEGSLRRSLINPKTLPFNEVFLFDLRSPHSQVFAPKTRFAIERALSTPHDYLDCECCAPTSDAERQAQTISPQHPATALLYQLYLETESMINASDLRTVFAGLVADVVTDEDQISALFQRSLAELSYLGFVKGTKKKTDHIVKLAWKGL